MMIWALLRAAQPWHLMLAAFVAWSGFVGVKAFRAGGEAAVKKIEKVADANVKKAETARAAVRPTVKPDADCVRDANCRR